MPTRIVVASPKGGCGKTTVSLNLALAFAERGYRTLLVDLDPQGGVGHSLAKQDTALAGLSDLLMQAVPSKDAIVKTKVEGFSLLPRGRLSPTDVCAFEEALRTPGVLEGVLSEVEAGYQIVILDAPSGLGFATRGALAIVGWVLVPVQAEPLALRSIGQMLQVIEHVRANENPELKLLGVLPVMANREVDASLDVMLNLWSDFAGVFETTVPRSEIFLNASAKGIPVAFLPGPVAPEARRFELLVDEIVAQLKRQGTSEMGNVDRPQRQLL